MKALIIVDMQKDFMPRGALATPNADELIAPINELMKKYPLVVATKDWHPKNHVSFAENHLGKAVGDRVLLDGDIEQLLWPVHCVRESEGARFADGLHVEKIETVFKKGIDPQFDSYSAFFDSSKQRATGLNEYLRSRKVESLTFVGVATEYCVLYSVLDARELGFDVSIVLEGVKAINLNPSDGERALKKMKAAGAHLVSSQEVLK